MAPACHILKVYTEVLTGFSHVYHSNSLNTTFLSQSCIPEAASGSHEGKQNTHSKDRGRNEEPPIAQVQLQGQTVVTSSHPPTLFQRDFKVKIVFMILLWFICLFYSVMSIILSLCIMKFSKGYMMCFITTNQMQKQIRIQLFSIKPDKKEICKNVNQCH